MNLSSDIIFRLIIALIMTAIVVRMLWFILRNYLERGSTQKDSMANLDALIEQKKRLLALNGNEQNNDAKEFITALQWGEDECFTPIKKVIDSNLNLTPPLAVIKKAALPLNRLLAKNSSLKNSSKEELINILCILTFHLLKEEQPDVSLAIENKELPLKKYLAEMKRLPQD